MNKEKYDIKKLAAISMMTALAFVSVAIIRIPVVSFLKYEPKDCIIAILAFLYGPAAAALSTVAVSLIEMITVSDTGLIGFFMNITASLLFVMPAALMYRRAKSLKIAVIGLAAGALLMTGGMILWNYVVTPFYMGTPRADVVKMLVPVFLPFNLFKGSLNAAITLLLYKRVAGILRKTGAVQSSQTDGSSKKSIAVAAICAAVIVTLILVLLAWRGII